MLVAHGDSAEAGKIELLLEEAVATYRELGMTGRLKRAQSFVRA
jgi:hypothetical protein